MTKEELSDLLIENGNLDRTNQNLMKRVDKCVESVYYNRLHLMDEYYLDDVDKYFRECVPSNEEFCYYKDFNPIAISKVMRKGCFFMATNFFGIYVPLIHEHLFKCIIPLNPINKFHYHKSINRAVRKHPEWTLSFDNCFEEVIRGINNSYDDSWVARDLAQSYTVINYSNKYNIFPVHLHSVELFDGDDNLIAGEIGFVTGESYISLSGFRTVDDSGNVQMAALGTYLVQNGFKVWDLGMQLDYKYNYGAIDFDRKAQLEVYNNLSDKPLPIPLDQNINVKELLKQ